MDENNHKLENEHAISPKLKIWQQGSSSFNCIELFPLKKKNFFTYSPPLQESSLIWKKEKKSLSKSSLGKFIQLGQIQDGQFQSKSCVEECHK